MLRRILDSPARAVRVGAAEQRGLTPLLWGYVPPDRTSRLDLAARPLLDPPTTRTPASY